MKKVLLLTFLAFWCAGFQTPLHAQKVESQRSLHEFKIGVGWPRPKYLQSVYPKPEISYTPNFYVYYGYEFAKRWKTTFTFSYYNNNEPRTSALNPEPAKDSYFEIMGKGLYSHYQLTPAIQFDWFRRGIITLYSDIGFTLDVVHKHDVFQGQTYQNGTYLYIWPSITPIGITIGRKLFFSAELFSLGAKGLVNVGIGYRL